ncbi:MAG: DUF177 domain-containing protein [Dehalococcoidia bacterium]|nr:DUF177 domain-containing protein [Dehalococcoidia bacterium]
MMQGLIEEVMLEANVAQLLKGNIGTEKVMSVDDCVYITGYGESAVNGSVKLMRTNRSVLVQGKLHTCIQAICARCLESYPCPLELDIKEEYFPITDVTTGIMLDETEESDDFTIDEHLILDLSEAVRQYALLAIPMKPLCRADCPGIKLN